MRHSLPLATALLATLLAGSVAGASQAMHVRGLNAESRDLITTAAARSTVVQALMHALEVTDLVVYVTVEPLPDFRRTGYLSFLSAAGGIRYVIVRLDSQSQSSEMAAMLGHELQHALEVAAARDVRDIRTFALLYRRIGWEAGPNRWETDSARSVGEQVLNELNSFRSNTIPGGSRPSPAARPQPPR